MSTVITMISCQSINQSTLHSVKTYLSRAATSQTAVHYVSNSI